MSTKIQINDRSVLDLLFKDKEFEVALKTTILDEALKRYVKAFINDEIIGQLKETIKKEVKKELDKTNFNDYIDSRGYPTTKLKEAIRKNTDFFIGDELYKEKKEVITKYQEKIEKTLLKNTPFDIVFSENYIKERIDSIIKDKLNKTFK